MLITACRFANKIVVLSDENFETARNKSFISEDQLIKIENPIMPDREQWTYNLGYRMWSVDEIRSGIVYKRFKEKLGL